MAIRCLRHLRYRQAVTASLLFVPQGAAGVLYFWSYMILVFLILLNFLLAIIVDAFSEIKETTKERTGEAKRSHSQITSCKRQRRRRRACPSRAAAVTSAFTGSHHAVSVTASPLVHSTCM